MIILAIINPQFRNVFENRIKFLSSFFKIYILYFKWKFFFLHFLGILNHLYQKLFFPVFFRAARVPRILCLPSLPKIFWKALPGPARPGPQNSGEARPGPEKSGQAASPPGRPARLTPLLPNPLSFFYVGWILCGYSKLFIFLKKFLVCLFPINTRDFKLKKLFLAKNKAKMVETDKIKNFFGETDKWKLLSNTHF